MFNINELFTVLLTLVFFEILELKEFKKLSSFLVSKQFNSVTNI